MNIQLTVCILELRASNQSLDRLSRLEFILVLVVPEQCRDSTSNKASTDSLYTCTPCYYYLSN